jgi:hypothetical protein
VNTLETADVATVEFVFGQVQDELRALMPEFRRLDDEPELSDDDYLQFNKSYGYAIRQIAALRTLLRSRPEPEFKRMSASLHIHADHLRFLVERGYRVAPPDQEDYKRSMAVDAENDAFVAKRQEAREKAGEPRSAVALWQESTEKYEAQKRFELISSWCSYHRDMVEKHRATLTSLIGYHEGEAERYRQALGGDAA